MNIRCLAAAIIVFSFVNVFGQTDSITNTGHVDLFSPCGQNTKITTIKKIDLNTPKFNTDIEIVEKNQLSIPYYTDTLACESFVYYKLSSNPNKYFILRNRCNEELLLIFLNGNKVRQGAIKYKPFLTLCIKGYRHRGTIDEILIHYTTDGISHFYCIFRYFDDKDNVDIIFDKKVEAK